MENCSSFPSPLPHFRCYTGSVKVMTFIVEQRYSINLEFTCLLYYADTDSRNIFLPCWVKQMQQVTDVKTNISYNSPCEGKYGTLQMVSLDKKLMSIPNCLTKYPNCSSAHEKLNVKLSETSSAVAVHSRELDSPHPWWPSFQQTKNSEWISTQS